MRHNENIKKIEDLKQHLIDDYNIHSDRDLVKQLSIKEEDKLKLYAWIRYQNAHQYKNGYEDGQQELKEQLTELITPKKETW